MARTLSFTYRRRYAILPTDRVRMQHTHKHNHTRSPYYKKNLSSTEILRPWPIMRRPDSVLDIVIRYGLDGSDFEPR